MIDVYNEGREGWHGWTKVTSEKSYCRWAVGGCSEAVIHLCQVEERLFSLR